MRRETLLRTLGLCAISFTSLLRPSQGLAADAPVEAKLAVFTGPGSIADAAAQHLAELAGKYSNGSVTIKVYNSSLLGSVPSVLQGLQNNTIQFAATSNLSSVVPESDATLLPYLFPTAKIAQEVLNGPALREKLWSKFDAHGMHVIGVWGQGFANLLTTRPVANVADMKGLRIRVFSSSTGPDVFSALGANATPMEISQVFTALSTHAIDGIDDPMGTFVAGKFYNVAHDLAVTEHMYVTAPLLVSTTFWSALAPGQRNALQRAWNETLPFEYAKSTQVELAAIQTMKEAGTTITHPDKKAFQAATSVVYEQLAKKFPDGIVETLRETVTSAGH